jgi:3-phosphoshikimate 1-carboxyvinyltransferase
MAFSIVAMFIGDCTVTDPDSASVSYPNFVSDMQNCGARISMV